MVQLINLGSLSTVNGKQVLNGSNSGLDDASLINELATAKALPATNLQTKITTNTSKIAAFSQLSTLMTTLQTSLDALRNPPGADASSNVFSARTPYITMSDGSTSSNYIGVTTANGAPIGNYTLAVNQLATAQSDQSSTFPDATSSVVGDGATATSSGAGSLGASSETNLQAGTFQLNGITITLTAGENLTNIASAINAVSSQSNVSASVVKLSNTDTRLVLTGTQTGSTNSISITNDTTNISSGNNLTVTQPAQDAQLQFNGNTVTRSTNSISDLVSGVTFSLYQPTPSGTTATLSIDKDDATVATAIGNFVTAYNAVRTFQATQNQRDSSGTLLSTSYLAEDPTLTTIANKLENAINSQTSDEIPAEYQTAGTTPTPTRLGDLGISLTTQAAVAGTTAADGTTTAGTPEVDNLLTVDATSLSSALDTNFDAVASIFQFGFTSSSSDLSDYSRDNTVMSSKFTVKVDTSQPAGQQAELTAIDGSALTTPVYLNYATTNGITTISGPSGTDLSDLNFVYSGDGNETIDNTQTLASKDFAISADPTAATASVTSIFGQALAAPVALTYSASGSSALLSGATGSPLAGLKMIFTGSTAESVNVSLQQGIGDSLYNDLDSMINGTGANDGLIDNATSSLTSTDTKLQTQIDQINLQVTSYRSALQTKFANLEAAIGSANQLLTLLSAQQEAANNAAQG